MVPVLRWHLVREGIPDTGDIDLERVVVAQRERTKTVREMAAMSSFFFRAPVAYDEKAVRKHVTADVLALFEQVGRQLSGLPDWSAPAIHSLLGEMAATHQLSLGKIAQPIRLAVCGGTVSPPIDETLAILGRVETLSRLNLAAGRWSVLSAPAG
jgi:glutamyl-tRNA synthetase